MAFFFGDGFDLYSAITDCGTYWDASFGGTVTLALSASGRFAGSRGIVGSAAFSGAYITKTSSVTTDPVHHISLAWNQVPNFSGAATAFHITFYDGASVQCCVGVRSDGAMILTTGVAGTGTVLDTWTGAVAAPNTWYQFEIEVVINGSTGSWAIRKNGNTSNDHALGSLNTRNGTANAQANKIGIGSNWATTGSIVDDFLWRSDASSVAWLGDIRCFTRMPASDSSVAWTRSGSVVPLAPYANTLSTAFAANRAYFIPFTAPCNGTIGTVTLPITTASTANLKCAIYNSSGGVPTTSFGSVPTVAAPGIGTATFTFSTPPSVTQGTSYFLAVDTDATSGNFGSAGASTYTGQFCTITYASFPTSNPTGFSASNLMSATINITPTTASNAMLVADTQQDGATTYVYSSTVSQSDLYTLQSISTTPASTVAVVTRGYMQKSDAGTRLAAVQLQSGGITVPAGGYTTWNSSDMGSNLVLSGGSLIVTTNAFAVANIRSVGAQTGTKFYFEQTFGTISGTEGVGIANASANMTTNSYTNTAFVTSGGAVWINGTMILSSIGTVSNGSLIGIAVDLANSLVWFRIGASGNWNGNSTYSPGGTGGQSISAFITSITPTYGYAAFNGSSSGSAITANFGASAFAGAVPSGFVAGFTALPTGTALNTTWGWLYRNDLVDPATSAAWTATAVNNALIGAVVTT